MCRAVSMAGRGVGDVFFGRGGHRHPIFGGAFPLELAENRARGERGQKCVEIRGRMALAAGEGAAGHDAGSAFAGLKRGEKRNVTYGNYWRDGFGNEGAYRSFGKGGVPHNK